jgi:hypothetical protein
LGLANRFDAAFVSRVFLETWFGRLKNSPPQPGEAEGDQRKDQRDANENDDEQIRIRLHRLRSNSLGKHSCQVYILVVEKTAKKFRSFADAEKPDRDFYKQLTGNERLRILVELLNHGPEQRLERVSRITKLPRR